MPFSLEHIPQAPAEDAACKNMLEHIFDVSNLQQLLEYQHKITGLAYGVFDSHENNLISVGWQDICVRFHRAHPVCRVRCSESDSDIKAHLGTFNDDLLEYRCKNGMVDIAVPIVVAGEHMATLFTGQFFFDDDIPDVECFRSQAEEFGFDPDQYLEALGRVPVFSREQVGVHMDFLRSMVGVRKV